MTSTSGDLSVLVEPIGIIGAGISGLINAYVLLQDGFTNVTILTRDRSVGGVWARKRVYPGLTINNVHGEYRLSPLEMPPPLNASNTGGRLTGIDLSNYMETFAETFLKGQVKFNFETEVLNIRRDEKGSWLVKVKELDSKNFNSLRFSKIILCTGGCSSPRFPKYLSTAAAQDRGFTGMVLHSFDFGLKLGEILATAKEGVEDDRIVVIGGGKSAQDISAKLANEGRNVTIIFEKTDAFLAYKTPLPNIIRKSRFLGLLSPHAVLRSRLEQFLHGTRIGSQITHFIWKKIAETSFDAQCIPQDSPLRHSHSLFWGVRTNDDGVVRPNSFHALVNSGKIRVIAPARVTGYSDDGKSINVNGGQSVSAKVVILATGYQSSWSNILDETTAAEIGMSRHVPKSAMFNTWDYASLANPPASHPDNELWVTSIYRGLVPAKNIICRDFAIAGALFTANFGYTGEVAAHWISSYFLGDKMRLPASAEEAIAEAENRSMWMKKRFPTMLSWVNESYSASLDFWTWPQAADELLEDMYLPSYRSGGNWLTWPFKIIDLKELSNLKEERRAKELNMLEECGLPSQPPLQNLVEKPVSAHCKTA